MKSSTQDPSTKPNQSTANPKTIWMLMLPFVGGAVILSIAVIVLWLVFDVSQPTSSVAVQGSATQTVIPDTASIVLYAEETGEDSARISSALDLKEQSIIQYLKEQGITAKDIESNRSIYDDFRYELNSDSPIQLKRGVLSIQITFTDIAQDVSKPRAIVQESIQKGVDRYNQFNYTFDDNTDVCQDLETKAIEDGLETASRRIDALGGGRVIRKTIQNVSGCGQGDYGFPVLYSEDQAIRSPESEPIQLDLNPGSLEIAVRVDLEVEFK